MAVAGSTRQSVAVADCIPVGPSVSDNRRAAQRICMMYGPGMDADTHTYIATVAGSGIVVIAAIVDTVVIVV